MTKLSPRYIAFAGVLMSIFAMASALYLQHFGGLEPCPLCTFQRVGYVAAGVLFFLAALHNPARIGRVIYGILIAIPVVWGTVVAGRHIWLQNLPADQVPECGPGLDYMLSIFPLQDVLSMVFSGSGECAEVDWTFIGLTLPELALAGFIALFATAIAWVVWPRSTPN
ncbi:MAG TPA: disulfide bond formation protein B [Alcanivoracaceae bacterium]|nr:disulfide bond formation protein B [Alcanivoracaceae bacterium]